MPDDLGESQCPNAVLDMIKHGPVTSSSDFSSSVFWNTSNLTEFCPTFGPEGLGSLLNNNGEFHGRMTTSNFGYLWWRTSNPARLVSCHFS